MVCKSTELVDLYFEGDIKVLCITRYSSVYLFYCLLLAYVKIIYYITNILSIKSKYIEQKSKTLRYTFSSETNMDKDRFYHEPFDCFSSLLPLLFSFFCLLSNSVRFKNI